MSAEAFSDSSAFGEVKINTSSMLRSLGLESSETVAPQSSLDLLAIEPLESAPDPKKADVVEGAREAASGDLKEGMLQGARIALLHSGLLSADLEDWERFALCAQTDPELFFPETGGGSAREAKRVCSRCEVREQCLEKALVNDERFGIWGGLSEGQRRKLRRRAV